MNPDDEKHGSLSRAGEIRRREILADALAAADRRRNVRAIRRAGAFVGVAGLLVAALLMTARHGDRGRDAVTVVIEQPLPPQSKPAGRDARMSPSVTPPRRMAATSRPVIVVEIISNEDVTPRWEILNDDQFLAALADAGQPSGLARLNGREFVVPLR